MATPARCSAATTYDQKTPDRSSWLSRETQATIRDSAAAHNARAIVLPAPPGPVTTVSGHHRVAWVISWPTRGRGTAQSGVPGAVILEGGTGTAAATTSRRARPATGRASGAVSEISRFLSPAPLPVMAMSLGLLTYPS